MKPPSRGPIDGRSRLAHQMLSATPTRSSTMSRVYSRAASGIWKTGDRAEPGRVGTDGVAVGGAGTRAVLVLGLNRCRCRPMSVAAATTTAPAPSANRSIPRSLRATACWWPDRVRPSVITIRIANTASRAIPTASPSRCSGPFQRGVTTEPRSPASPKTISSTSGSNRSHSWRAPARAPTSPGAPTRPVVSGGIAPGWRLVMASFLM